MGENNSWFLWDDQILGLVRSLLDNEFNNTVNAIVANALTAGVSMPSDKNPSRNQKTVYKLTQMSGFVLLYLSDQTRTGAGSVYAAEIF